MQTLNEVAGVNTYTFTAEQDYNYALLLFLNGGATITSMTTSGNGTLEIIDEYNDPHLINIRNVSLGDTITINSHASGRNRGIILK